MYFVQYFDTHNQPHISSAFLFVHICVAVCSKLRNFGTLPEGVCEVEAATVIGCSAFFSFLFNVRVDN